MATIIETAAAPAGRVTVDPVTLDIIENALRNARYEMDAVLFRTAMSPGIREQHDEFPLVANPDGKMVVGQFGLSIPGLLDGFPGTISEGDVLMTSDPYSCGAAISHANDWLVLLPVFHQGALIGWASMFGHMTDVGGKVPGSLPTDATTIYEEGVVVPPFKLYRKGELNAEALGIILNQVRMKEWNRSDLNAIVAACRTAGQRMTELCDRFGQDVYLSALDALLERNYRAMKQLIETTIPAGETLTFTDYVCDDGMGYGPYKIHCAMYREGEKVVLDFAGTDPQSPGPINYYLNEDLYKMFFTIYMIMVFDPQILWNDGGYPLIDVRIPEGTLLKPRYPAALSCRTHVLGRIFDILGGLLGQRQPEFLNAAGFSDSPHLMYSGHDADGRWFQLYQIGFGGIPGRPFGDGPDGHSLWPSFTNVPNEFLESYFPLVIERYETIPDSGGPGRFRGGNGIDIAYRFQATGEISIHDDRWFTYPGASTAAIPAAAAASGWNGPTAAPRSCRPSATTSGSRPATCCTTRRGAAGAGAARWSATPSWWPWRCAAGWSAPPGRGATGWCWPTTARWTPPPRSGCARSPPPTPGRSCSTTGSARWTSCASAAWPRPGCPRRSRRCSARGRHDRRVAARRLRGRRVRRGAALRGASRRARGRRGPGLPGPRLAAVRRGGGGGGRGGPAGRRRQGRFGAGHLHPGRLRAGRRRRRAVLPQGGGAGLLRRGLAVRRVRRRPRAAARRGGDHQAVRQRVLRHLAGGHADRGLDRHAAHLRPVDQRLRPCQRRGRAAARVPPLRRRRRLRRPGPAPARG
jgi:N-methylhydantoinase B